MLSRFRVPILGLQGSENKNRAPLGKKLLTTEMFRQQNDKFIATVVMDGIEFSEGRKLYGQRIAIGFSNDILQWIQNELL